MKASVRGGPVLFALSSPYGISRSVMLKATQLATGLGVELELFYRAFDSDVGHPGRLGAPPHGTDIQAYVDHRQRQLDTLAQEMGTPGLTVTARVEWDTHSDEAILREVLRRQPALVVVESFPHTPGEGLIYGHRYHRLIETCPCPLLLVRNAQTYPAHPRVFAAVDPLHAHAKTAALDDAIVTAASKVSAALSGDLHLFHARLPWPAAMHQLRGPHWIPDVLKVESQVAYEHLVQLRLDELARCHDISAQRLHLVDGEVRECLPSYARVDAIDILAMGALSRSMLQRILIGETAQRLLEKLECDLLIVKEPARPTGR